MVEMDNNRLRAQHVMKDLRERWGNIRYVPGDEQTQRQLFVDSSIRPFFDQAEASRKEEPIRFDQLEDLRSHLRSIRREKWSTLQTPKEEADVAEQDMHDSTSLQAKRLELLSEIASEQFRSGMLSWLTSVNPENDLSASSLEELEEIERQTRYRLKVIEVMQFAMERELDAIEKEVRAKDLHRSAKITPDGERE